MNYMQLTVFWNFDITVSTYSSHMYTNAQCHDCSSLLNYTAGLGLSATHNIISFSSCTCVMHYIIIIIIHIDGCNEILWTGIV